MRCVKKLRELGRGMTGYIRSHLWVSIMGSLMLLFLLVAIVPGAANVLLSKLIDPILDQHMPKKEG